MTHGRGFDRCVLAVALALAAFPSHGQPVAPDIAFGAFQRGYYVTALKQALLRLEANPGDAVAMTLVGVLYQDGTGVKKDLPEASRWFRLAAERGNREAQFALAMLLLQAQGIPEDRPAAIALLEKAAANGHAGAMYNLGIVTLESAPAPPDYPRAVNFFERAAGLGDADANYALGLLYREGRGAAVDPQKALRYLAEAAASHHIPGTVEYAIALFNGTGVDKDEAAAARLFLKAAYANNPVAQNRMARILVVGRGGMNKDLVEAMKWHLLARASGLQDEWLDTQLKMLSTVEQAEVELAVRAYVGK